MHYSLPNISVLNSENEKYDYIDCFEGELLNSNIQISDVAASFFKSSPKWVEQLFRLRHAIVRHIGLKTEMLNIDKDLGVIKEGDKIGFFKVYKVLENEIMMGENDSHLNFKCSILITRGEKTQLSVTTAVTFNNRFGRVYFMLIKTFHKLIVGVMMKNVLRDLNR